jgi:hypothetical protein
MFLTLSVLSSQRGVAHHLDECLGGGQLLVSGPVTIWFPHLRYRLGVKWMVRSYGAALTHLGRARGASRTPRIGGRCGTWCPRSASEERREERAGWEGEGGGGVCCVGGEHVAQPLADAYCFV